MAELDTDRIAAAALAVADEKGVAGFTMRAVADALDVTPMALYHHVADKAGLVALVVDEVINGRPLPPPTGVWQDDLWEMAVWLRHTAVAHPNVGQLRRIHKVWTPTLLPMTERWFNVWQRSGLDLDHAILAATTSSMAIIGLVDEEQLFREMAHPDAKLLDPLPNTRVAFNRPPDRDREFELVVRSLIDGIHARLTAEAAEADAASPGTASAGAIAPGAADTMATDGQAVRSP